MNGNGGMVSARLVDNPPRPCPSGIRVSTPPMHKRAGIDNLITYEAAPRRTSPDRDAIPAVATNSTSNTPCRFMCRWSMCGRSGLGGSDRLDHRCGPAVPGKRSATPGPICYAVVENPTITDANLVLGRLNAKNCSTRKRLPSTRFARFTGEDRRSARDRCRSGSQQSFVSPMTEWLARVVSISKGYDPRDFTLFAFGGAGPLHAASLSRS